MPKRIPYSRPGLPPTRGEDKAERDAFYSGRRWRCLRAAFLASHPLCESCLKQNRVTVATVAHHIRERLKAPALAYDEANLEASCDPCHTATHKRKSN